MSNKTFDMSADHGVVPLPHRDLQQGISSERHYSNPSLCTSPDSSSRSISNLIDREATSPDINSQECCLSNADNPSTTLSQDNMLFDVRTHLNQTFIARPVDGSVNIWNEKLTVMSKSDTGSDSYQPLIKNTENRSNNSVMSPDSHRGSTENDYCSLSSGEMVLRNNSFCLEDQSHLVVSSLEESSVSLPSSHPVVPVESNLLSTTLCDVCEKSPERLNEEKTSYPCLGMTFTQPELPNEEDDNITSNCALVLPSESEGCLLMTFVCETPPADCGKEDQLTSAEAQLLHFPAVFTPEQGKAFGPTLSAVQDTDKDIHTSTPIQNMENKISSLPSLSESPCTENAGTSELHPVKGQQMAGASNHLPSGLLSSISKVKKIEIKKFPKSDFNSVKSKVVTRNAHKMSVPGPASQHKPSHVNMGKCSDAHRGASVKISPANLRSSPAVISTIRKMVSGAQRQVNTANLGVGMTPSSGRRGVDGQGMTGASPPHNHSTANKHASASQCSNASSETKHAASSQVLDAPTRPGTQTVCFASLEKSADKIGQTNPKPTPKKGMSNKIEASSGSASGLEKPPVFTTRPRCSSESSSLSSLPLKGKKTFLRFSTSFAFPRGGAHLDQTKSRTLNSSSKNKKGMQAEGVNSPNGNSKSDVTKISLVKMFSKSKMAGASRDDSKSTFRGRLSPEQTRGASLSQAPAASPRLTTLSTRQRQATLERDEFRTSKDVGTPHTKLKSTTGSQRPLAVGKPTLGNTLTVGIKPQLRSQTPTRPSLLGLPPTPASRLPRKTQGPSRSLTESLHTELSEVSGGAACKPTPVKTALLKTKLGITPAKNSGKSASATTCKSAASTSKGASNLTVSPLKRTGFARFARLTSSVDKNKPKASSRQQPSDQQASQRSQSNGPPDVVPARVTGTVRKDQSIHQLKGFLAASNCRFEAVAIVLQQALAERDEATRQCRVLSQELVNLRGELDCSVHSSERLGKEKEELYAALEESLQKLQEQHQKDLTELEQRLQAFYQAEWDKVHLTYQEEADNCKTLMHQQIGELKANHEAMKQELEDSHIVQLQCVKRQYEESVEELCKVHNQELQSLGKTLRETESVLSGQIEALTVENNSLIEKLTAEEKRRKELAESSQKDSRTLYLEQELESLKVVLDIKNKQLHQQEKKLMEIDKLKDKNVKLDESLIKIQQENEDLKARMDRHAALSRQLSTEQAVLQESLQKESKVNKRLSMENEELLWKLHNGDLSSPHRASPTSTSPSHSFSLQSPRSSGLFSSPPMSPR